MSGGLILNGEAICGEDACLEGEAVESLHLAQITMLEFKRRKRFCVCFW